MPCAIDLGTYFVMRLNGTNKVNVYSMQFEEMGLVSFEIDDESKNHSYVDYVKGVIKILEIKDGNLTKTLNISDDIKPKEFKILFYCDYHAY